MGPPVIGSIRAAPREPAVSARAPRRNRVVESFRTAAECIGPITPGMGLFAINRGQFSMIDALLHCLDCVGRAEISLWTWTVAIRGELPLERLLADARITAATLVIETKARDNNRPLLTRWLDRFGPGSIRALANHGKIATVRSADFRLLLRGSMNLNQNARFEQFDLTEGGLDFDLVRRVESELPCLPMERSIIAPSDDLFAGLKPWAR